MISYSTTVRQTKKIPGLNIIQQNHFPNQSTARTDHSHIPHSGNGITGEKSSKVLAWAILFFCFVKIYCAGNFAYIILRAVDAQGGISAGSRGFSWNPEISGKLNCPHAILIEPWMDDMQQICIRMARTEGFWVWLRMRRNHPFRPRGIHQSKQARITDQRERSRPLACADLRLHQTERGAAGRE